MKKRKNNQLLIFILGVFIITLFLIFFFLKKSVNNYVVFPDQTIFEIELAKTPKEQALGLAKRDKIDPLKGMLFIFPKKQKPTFWMKDMNFPIDLLWLDNGKIIDWEKNMLLDQQTYQPDQNIDQVLEIAAGTIKKHHLKIGDQLKIISK